MLKNSLLIMTRCFLLSLYYIIVFFIFFFTPESTQSDGRGSRSIRWLHINVSVLLFLPRFTRTAGSFVIDFFSPLLPSLPFPISSSDYSCSSANTSGSALQRKKKKEGSYTCGCRNKCITVWVLCPGLSTLSPGMRR